MTYDSLVNPVLWVIADLELFFVSLVMLAFVAIYFFVYRWFDYAAGRSIMVFTAALLLVLILIDTSQFTGKNPWFVYPTDSVVWRPALRVAIYGIVSYAAGRLLWQLIDGFRNRKNFIVNVDPRTRPGFPHRSASGQILRDARKRPTKGR